MKKIKYYIFVFFFVCFLLACNKSSNELIQIQVKDFINESYIVDELNIEEYKLILYYSDGTKEYIDITSDMISDSDKYMLDSEGNHNLQIKYQGFITEISYEIIKSDIKYRFDYYLAELDGSYTFNSSQSFNTAFEIEFDFEDYDLKEFEGFVLENRYELLVDNDTKVYQFFYSRNEYNLNIYVEDRIVFSKKFLYGEKIDLNYVPEKENYTFSGYNIDIPEYMGIADVNLVSKFEPIMLTYRFFDYDGTLIGTKTSIKGSIITLPNNPGEYNDEKYTYTFEKWDNYHNGMILNESIDFTAVYSVHLNEYLVIFKNIDETILYIQKVKYGQTAIYLGEEPIRPQVEDKNYIFIGWDKSLNNITSDLVIYPLYEDITNKVLVNIVVDNKSYIEYVEIGSDIDLPESPFKEGYTFLGWDKSNLNITDSTTITAQFEINYYNISYLIDGELFGDVENLAYGSEISKKTAPKKDEHIFIGWSNEIDVVPASDYVVYGHYINIYDLHDVYDGVARKFSVYDSYKDYSINYYYNDEIVRNIVNAGDYKVILDFTEFNDLSYTFVYEFKISKANSIITANDIDVVYDGDEYSILYSLNHDEAEIVSTLNSFITAGEYFVTLSVPETKNYLGLTITKTVNIRKKTYDISSISFDSQTYIYDGTKKSIEISGELPEGLSVEYSLNSLTNAGEIDVVATFSGDFVNYVEVKPMEAKLTISKRNAIIKIDNQESLYGEELRQFTYDLVNVVDFLDIEIMKEEGLIVGDYELTTLYSNDNYNFTVVNGVYKIKRATYNLENIKFSEKSYIYDGTEKELIISGILPEGLTVSYVDNKLTNVGSTTAKAIFSGDFENYYPVDDMISTLVITKKPAYILIDSKTSIFGEELTEFTSTNIGFIENDNIEYEIIKEEGLEVGNYLLTTLYENDNYDINIVNGYYRIISAAFAGLKFENKVVEYDGNFHFLEALGGSDSLSVQYSNNLFKDSGIYEVEAIVSDGLDSVTLTATLTITKKNATILIDSKNSVYGEELTSFTYSLDGFIENINVEVLKENGLNAGEYKLYTNYVNNNYNIEYINGIYTIEKAEPVITMDTDQTLFEYNGNEHNLTASLNHNECKLIYLNNNRIATGNYVLKVISQETQNYNYGEFIFNYSIKYVVNFYNNNGEIIYTTHALLNDSVDFPLDYPIGDSSDFYYYEFNNWDKDINCIKGNTEIYPEFIIQPIKYVVQYIDGNGSILKEVKNLNYGDYVEEPLKAVKTSTSSSLAYIFSMWNPVDYENSVKTSKTERTITVEAIYEEVPAVAMINNNYFGNIVDALYASNSGDIVVVIKNNDGNYLISEDVIIKDGVTLYLPYDQGIPVDCPNGVLYNGTFSENNCYLNITLSNCTLTVYGDLIIGAVIGNSLYKNNNFLQGVINGAFSKIIMDNNSKIIVGDGILSSNLVCYGIIEDISSNGNSSISVNKNSVLAENFVIYDWRNENYMLSNFYNRGLVSPFNRYQLPYIKVPIRFNYGAFYQGIGKVYSVEMDDFYGMPFNIIGTGNKGMFRCADNNSYIIKDFFDSSKDVRIDSYTDNLKFDLYGDVNIYSLNIMYNLVLYSTEQVYFPIPYSMSINLHNCSMVINNKYKVLPGAKFVIDSDSMVIIRTNNIKDGVEPQVTSGLSVYESYDFNNAIKDIYPNSSQLTAANKKTYGEFINNGKFIIDSNFVYIGGKLTGDGELIKNYPTYKGLMREIPNLGVNSDDISKSDLILYYNGKRIGDNNIGTYKKD